MCRNQEYCKAMLVRRSIKRPASPDLAAGQATLLGGLTEIIFRFVEDTVRKGSSGYQDAARPLLIFAVAHIRLARQ